MSANNPLALLTQSSTIYGGTNPLPMFNLAQSVPGMNSGNGMLLSMLLQPMLMQMSQSLGYPALQFAGTQNMFDRLQAQDFFLESRKAIAEASVKDRDQYFQKFLGFSRLTGTKIGPEQVRAAYTMADDVSKMGAILGDFMPETFDAMHGSRGSAAMLARRLHTGGRYALDPITGELGFRGETAGRLTAEVYENLFGVGKDISSMQGLGAGRIGQLFDELQRRGLMSGAPTTPEQALSRSMGRGRADNVTQLARDMTSDPSKNVGLTTVEFDKMEEQLPGSGVKKIMESSDVRDQMFKTEAGRISNRLKSLVGTVSAMRDIFGDMGKPDAPMVELINGLQALTQGGLATMSPGQLEMMVRKTQQLSRMGGVSMEGVMQMASRGAGLADQMGLDRQYAMPATQGSIAFATAFNTTGAGISGWKMPDKDAVTALDQSLRLSGASSDVANQFNATLRIAKEMDIDQTSEFASLAKAIESGKTRYSWTDPKNGQTVNKSVVMQLTDWVEMANKAGVSQNNAFMMRSYTAANQEYGAKYNTGDLTRLIQRDVDINPLLAVSGNLVFGRITENREAQTALTKRAIEVIWGSDDAGNPIAGGMSATDRADPVKRNEIMLRELRKTAQQQNINLTDAQLRQAAATMWADAEDRIQKTPGTRAYGGLLGALALHDPATLRMAQQHLARANDRAQLSSALGGIGRTGMVRRFVDMLDTASPNTTLTEMIVETIGGGVNATEYSKALDQFVKTRKEYDAASDSTPEGQSRRQNLSNQLRDITNRLRSVGGDKGVLGGELQILGLLYRDYESLTKDIVKAEQDVASATTPADKDAANKKLQSLMDQKAQVAQQLSQASSQVTQSASSLGFSTGGVGSEDVKRALQLNQNLQDVSRTSTLPEGARTGEPERAESLANKYVTSTQGLTWGLLFDDNKLKLLAKDKGEGLTALTESNERWRQLNTISSKTGISIDQLVAGTGKFSSLDVDTQKRVKDLLAQEAKGLDIIGKALEGQLTPEEMGNPLSGKAASTVASERERQMRVMSAQASADNMFDVLRNLGKEYNIPDLDKAAEDVKDRRAQIDTQQDGDPERGKLVSRLSVGANRARVDDMLQAFERFKVKLKEDESKTGQKVNLAARDQMKKLEQLAGSDFNSIKPILEVLQGSRDVQDIVPAAEPAKSSAVSTGAGSSSTTPVVAKLDGPLKVEGTVKLVGNDLQFVDTQTGNHRVPVMTAEA